MMDHGFFDGTWRTPADGPGGGNLSLLRKVAAIRRLRRERGITWEEAKVAYDKERRP